MSNLTQRILSAVVLIPIVLGLLFYGPVWSFCGFVVFIAALLGFEYATITLAPEFKAYRLLTPLLAAMSSLSFAFMSERPLVTVFALMLIVVLPPIVFMFSRTETREAVTAAASTTTGALYAGVLTGFIILLYLRHQPSGSAWIFALFAAAVLNDTGAYTVGRLWGRRKLFPRISPGKTWAGAFGGVAGTVLGIGISIYFFLPQLPWLTGLLLALPLSAAYQFGDLSESFLKRGYGVKDSGHIIPGHGGIFDRIDALIFGAPVLFFFSMLK
jgi:phosphatidate cytidylyltransferase